MGTFVILKMHILCFVVVEDHERVLIYQNESNGGADRSPGKTIISLVNEIYLSMIKPIPEKAPFLA